MKKFLKRKFVMNERNQILSFCICAFLQMISPKNSVKIFSNTFFLVLFSKPLARMKFNTESANILQNKFVPRLNSPNSLLNHNICPFLNVSTFFHLVSQLVHIRSLVSPAQKAVSYITSLVSPAQIAVFYISSILPILHP